MNPVQEKSPEPAIAAPPAPNRRAFWDRHPGLVWSNRNAPDDAFIGAALRKGRFLELLDIAVEFGLERLLLAWQVQLSCGDLRAGLIAHVEENLSILQEAHARVLAARHR